MRIKQTVAVATAAVAALDVTLFNPVIFWKLVYDIKDADEIDNIERAIAEAGPNQTRPDSNIFFPHLPIFLTQIKSNCKNPTAILNIIAKTCVDANYKKIIESFIADPAQISKLEEATRAIYKTDAVSIPEISSITIDDLKREFHNQVRIPVMLNTDSCSC